MSLGKFDTPPPQAPAAPADLIRWATDLVAWIRSEESGPADTLEDDFIFGGEGVANRMYGFEDTKTGPITPPTAYTIVAPPAAGRKKIVTDLIIAVTGDMTLQFYKYKGSTRYLLVPAISLVLGPPSTELTLASDVGRHLVLDDTDESLMVEVTAYTSGDLHWNGNYLDVD